MKAINLLTRTSGSQLTPEEEAMLTRELSDAYHMDEAAATSRDVQRIAEKVKARLDMPPIEVADSAK
jgi:ubiquinone biosynthesis protein UbiJ